MNQNDKNEIGVSLLKSALADIPFFGGLLTEALFDFRSRIKQDRLNAFTRLLKEFFIENPNIDPEM